MRIWALNYYFGQSVSIGSIFPMNQFMKRTLEIFYDISFYLIKTGIFLDSFRQIIKIIYFNIIEWSREIQTK